MILFLSLQSGAVYDGTEKEAMGIINKQLGSVITHNEMPALYKSMGEVLRRAALAQRKNDAGSQAFVSDTKLLIVDSLKIPTAAVLTLQKSAISSQRNLVIISTGFIEVLFSAISSRSGKSNAKETLSILVDTLAGVLSHELAHPIFYQEFDPKSKQVPNQVEEILADSRGVQIAETAGYSRTGLLLGLQILSAHFEVKAKLNSNVNDAIRAGLATHPEKVLRETHLRTLYLIRKMLEGADNPRNPDPQSPAVLKEIAKIIEAQNSEKKTTFPTLSRWSDFGPFIKDLKAISDFSYGHKLSDANILSLNLDFFLARNPDLPENEKAEILELFRELSTKKLIYADHYDHSRKSSSLSPLVSDLHEQGYTANYFHSDYLLDSPFYTSSNWVKLVKAKLPNFSNDAKLILEVLSPTEIIRNYGPELEAFIYDKIVNEPSVFVWFFEHKSLRHKLYWSKFFHSQVFPKLSAKQRGKFMKFFGSQVQYISERANHSKFEKIPNFDVFTFFSLANDKKAADQVTESAWETLVQLSNQFPSDKKAMIELATDIWNNRDIYIGLDFIHAEKAVFNWDLVLKMIGMDKSVGYAELNRTLSHKLGQTEFHNEVQVARNVFETDTEFSKNKLWWVSDPNLESIKGKLGVRGYSEGVVQRVYSADSEIFRNDFSLKFNPAISAITKVTAAIDIQRIVEQTFQSMTGKAYSVYVNSMEYKTNLPAPIEDKIAEAIWALRIPDETKKELLKDRYLKTTEFQGPNKIINSNDPASHWLLQGHGNVNFKVFDVLKQAGLVTSVSELFAKVHPRDYNNYRYKRMSDLFQFSNSSNGYSNAIEKMGPYILQEISSIAAETRSSVRARGILNSIYLFLIPQMKSKADSKFDKEIFREMRKRIAEIALNTPMALSKRIKVFEALTQTGSIDSTDEYFKKAILPDLTQISASDNRMLSRVLNTKRFVSQNLTIEVARRLLMAQATSLKSTQIDDSKLITFIETIDRLLPIHSIVKDELIEDLNWRLEIQDDRYIQLMEAHKSTNWRRLNPQLVNWASFISSNLGNLPPSEIKELIEYLIDPHHRDIPNVLDRAFVKAADDIVAENEKKQYQSKIDPETKEALVREALGVLKNNFSRMAKDSSPLDRVPIFDLLLNTGLEPLVKDPTYPRNVVEEILKYKKGSSDEIALRSWLETIPAKDRIFEESLSLAFQISMAGSEKSSVKKGFQLFGTIGKKTGQGASIFEAFSPEVNADLADLKDDRRGMTKWEIKQVLKNKLGHDQFEVIQLLGSASIKTVALIRLENGRLQAAHIRNPGARETLKMHIDRSKAFVSQLSKNGLSHESLLFKSYIEALEQSIPDELDFRIEARKYTEMSRFFKDINSTMSKEMDGWKFSVPNIDPKHIQEDFFLSDYAGGESFHEFKSGIAKTNTGRYIFKAMAKGLINFGIFEPDRHNRNIKIDERSKLIHMLDPGQFQNFSKSILPFKNDDRTAIAKFLFGVSRGDLEVLVEAIQLMKAPHAPMPDAGVLRSIISKIFKEHSDPSQRTIELIKNLYRQNVKMDFKFSFTALKGLMVLVKENYVTADEAQDILREAVSKLLLRKLDIKNIQKVRRDDNREDLRSKSNAGPRCLNFYKSN